MFNALNLLESYKDQVSIAIQFGLLITSAILIFVGLKQAEAASAQAITARAQASSAVLQVKMASEQLRATLMASDAALRPLLKASFCEFKIRPHEGFMPDAKPEQPTFKIENRGVGPAMNIEIFYGENPSDTAASDPFTALGVGSEFTETFEDDQLVQLGVTIRYESVHGSVFETKIFPLDGNISGSIFIHQIIKQAFPVKTGDA